MPSMQGLQGCLTTLTAFPSWDVSARQSLWSTWCGGCDFVQPCLSVHVETRVLGKQGFALGHCDLGRDSPPATLVCLFFYKIKFTVVFHDKTNTYPSQQIQKGDLPYPYHPEIALILLSAFPSCVLFLGVHFWMCFCS